MAKEKRTVSEYLKELKVLHSRIVNATERAAFCGVKVGPKLPIGFDTRGEFDTAARASKESIEKLIKNRSAIKSAIVLSNATTQVTIAGTAMSVAEAIEKKASIEYQKGLLSRMNLLFMTANNTIGKGNADVKARLDQMLIASRGKEGKADAEADAAFSKAFMENNELTLLDPLKLRDQIEVLRDQIDAFEANVDTQLSISNAVTMIEVDL